MSRFRRVWKCEKGHVSTAEGVELAQCLVWTGPVNRRVRCDAPLREIGRVRKQGVGGGRRGT